MLFIFVLMILTELAYTACGNAGSAIFNNRGARNECWSEDDLLKLHARQVFENILPAQLNPDEVNRKYIRDLLRYFRRTLHSVEQDVDPHVAVLLKEALADTIGAHLRNEILPTARFAFYAGYVPYRAARQIHDFFDEIKDMLNTRGLGWKRPERAPQWTNLTVGKILIGAGSFFDPCTCLVIKRDSNSCIHLPTPRHDDDAIPSAIALPFKTGGLVSLTSPSSHNALLKYYTTAARCILGSSPENCRHSDFLSFNNELWNWMKRDIAPRLVDEKLYTAYGGVLRIAAAVQTYGKGLTRRNLFEYQEACETKWHPWKAFTESYIYINTDWSPELYVGIVVAVALAIYLVLIIYNFLFHSCHCQGTSGTSNPISAFFNDKTSANVELNSPAVLPQQSAVYYSNKKRVRPERTSSKARSASLGSVRTQRVYDLNENTEKLMAVLMSGSEESASESSVSDSVEASKSPPKLETSISEIKIEKRADKKFRSPIYSTSTVTREPYGAEQRPSDSAWSASESCSSQSETSTSSISNKSRSSRDLAWARRIISKHSVRSFTKSNSTSRTEIDINSFTTPQS